MTQFNISIRTTFDNMKKIFAILVLSLGAAICQAADNSAALTLTFSLTGTVNNPVATTNGVTATYKPTKLTLTTATLLKLIAADEFTNGSWASNSFPKSSKIVLMLNNTNYQGNFVITDKTGTNVLLDISNIFTITIQTDRIVKSGKLNTTTGLWSGAVQNLGAELYFDDASTGGNTIFTLAGVLKDSISDTLKSGQVTEKETVTLSPAIGLGYIGSGLNAAVFSGKATLAGTTKFPLAQ
jgi:hypothetical protein